MAEAAGKMDISRVLNNTFGVITRHPAIYLGLSFLIIGIPNALLQTAEGNFTTGSNGFNISTSYSSQGLSFFVLMLLSIWAASRSVSGNVSPQRSKNCCR